LNQSGETRARGFGREPSRWRDDAACRSLADTYFDPWDSDDKATEPTATAAQICGTCPVRRACLIEAIARNEPYGTWGGLTLKQRKKLTRARKRIKCPICSGTLLALADDHTQMCLACGIAWRTIAATRNAPRTTQERQPMSPSIRQRSRTRTA
jgi:WhiB family redox-sensing transcriptional regulator